MSSFGDKSGLEEMYENLQFQLMIPWGKTTSPSEKTVPGVH